MAKLPSRPASHILEAKSDRFLRNNIPVDWIVDRPIDYGIDYRVELVQNGEVLGYNFSIQLKAHEIASEKGEISITLKRSTINFYLNRLEPILLVCYVSELDEGYYMWFLDSTIDLTKSNETYTLKFKKANKISSLNWNVIRDHVHSVFSRKFLLNAIPQIDFSKINNEDEKIAMAYYIRGEYEQAGQIYCKLLAIGQNVNWLSALSMCQYSLYRYDEALVTINKALEFSDMPELYANKASILAEGGIQARDKAKLLEAKSIFGRIIKQFDEPHYYYNYANTLTELGEYGVAESYYKKSLHRNPNYAEAWKNLGQVYFHLHNHKKEIICYNNALLLKPNLPQALMSKGIYLVSIEKKTKEGLEFMEEAYNKDPQLFYHFQMAYYWFAYSFFKLEQNEKGKEYLDKGLNHHPGNPYLLDLKKNYFRRNWESDVKVKDDAISFLKFGLELCDYDYESLSFLLEIYLRSGYHQDALTLLKKHTVLLESVISFSILEKFIPYTEYLGGLSTYHEYSVFRHEFPIERYFDSEIVDKCFWDVIELIGLSMFNVALRFCKMGERRRVEKGLVEIIISYALEHYPKSAPMLVSATREEPEIVSNEIASALTFIPQIALRESGIMIGYLTKKLKFNIEKVNKHLTDVKEAKNSSQLLLSCLDNINTFHEIFPDE